MQMLWKETSDLAPGFVTNTRPGVARGLSEHGVQIWGHILLHIFTVAI